MTPHVRLKPGAAFPTLAPAGLHILAALEAIAHTMNVTVTISSGSEPRGRAPTDPHMTGEAADISVQGWTETVIHDFAILLRTHLGAGFTVLIEAPPDAMLGHALAAIVYRNPNATALHIHCQRRKGTQWP